MFTELDFRSHIPIYTQMVDRIKHLIASGVLEPGDQLPTVRQMAAELRVNFNTIARAYRILDEEGVISTQQGRGTYVLEPLPPERASRLRSAALEGMTKSFLEHAHQVGFKPEEVSMLLDELIDTWREEGEPPKAED
ncbi:MAG: GntR family transcriptional regulator [Anaerolineales bacterium]|jgi:GntR family transcriptional regulator|nr:GntR family transcriptional regulator [Anaerolineales bacterium]